MNLAQAIQVVQKGKVPVLAEIKRRIPRLASQLGTDSRDAGILACLYSRGGAAAISLVAEPVHFGGQPGTDIPAVLKSTDLPLLVKDFILDREKIDYYHCLAAETGPSCPDRVALLLTAHMVEDRLESLLEYIHGRGMLALVETKGEEDLAGLAGLKKKPLLVGFNNKYIDELEMGEDRIRLTAGIVSGFRRVLGGVLIVSESAHHSPADVRRSIAAGADAVLAGTVFMASGDPAGTVASFVSALED